MVTPYATRRIYGASLIGIALVAGALVVSRLSQPATLPLIAAAETLTVTGNRDYIGVADSNNDGIEDWREEFIAAGSAIVVAPSIAATSSFVATTVTDQVSVQLMEVLLQSKTGAGGPVNQVDLINKTTERLATVVQDKLYTKRDIIVVLDSEESIVNYANTMGQSVMINNLPGSENELDVLNRAVQTGNVKELEKIQPVAAMYKTLRDEALKTPVPQTYADEHLVMINVYNALYHNLDDMQLVFNDPAVTLLRINRYRDDVTGLVNGFKLFNGESLRHEDLFAKDDPVWIFSLFSE